MKYFSDLETCFISLDDYYITAGTQTAEENKLYDFDRPDAIDYTRFIADIHSLISGRTVYKSAYTFNNPKAQPKVLEIKPAPLIFIEGIFILHFPETAELLDLKIFLATSEETALQRRLQRDKTERGYPEEDILYKWREQVRPAYNKFLLPHRDICDKIILNDVKNDIFKSAEELADVIKKKLSSR